MEESWLSIAEVERKVRIPDATIRRYIKTHGHHLHIRRQGKIYLISYDSLSTIKRIRELYERGKQVQYIEEVLQKMNIPMEVVVEDGGKDVAVNTVDTLLHLQRDVKEQRQIIGDLSNYIDKQNELLNALTKKIDQQHEKLEQRDQRLEERDNLLMQSLKESQETRKQIATTEEEKKKGFWTKLFGGKD